MRPEREAETAAPPLEALLAGVAGGDARALEALYRNTAPKLLGVILAVVGDRATAEELLQETFLSVWRQAGRFEPARGRPMTWLITIARNRAIDAARRTARRPSIDEATDPAAFRDEGPGPEQAALSRSDAEALNRCLAALTEPQRLCIELAYWRGYTHSELATLMSRPVGTIKSWTRRGLMSLKECLSQ